MTWGVIRELVAPAAPVRSSVGRITPRAVPPGSRERPEWNCPLGTWESRCRVACETGGEWSAVVSTGGVDVGRRGSGRIG